MRGDKVERFTPHSLPPAARLPRLPTLFDGKKSDIPKPSQRQLFLIVHHQRWGALYDLAAARDAAHPHPRVRGYETTRVIEHSQTGAGAWLDMPCDGTNATRFTSEEHAVGLQRKLGLHLATAHHAHDTLEARGELVDRSGTKFENDGEHTTRHGALTGAMHAALAAVATGPIVSGDKDPRKRELQRHKMDQFNEGYISDLVAIGMGYGGADVCYENKCGSPLTTSQNCHGKGTGSKKKGGALAAMGSTHGFGNTNEYYRNKILGVQGRGRAGDKPFDHATGRGWLRPQRGDYHDAIHVKKNSVVAIITEPSGGIAPQGYAHLKMLARTIGGALEGGLPRSELFVTSKLFNSEHDPANVRAACEATLADLKLDYLDLYLIHWPQQFEKCADTNFPAGNVAFPREADGSIRYARVPLADTWAAMEALVDAGLVRAIGVSNFNAKQLRSICEGARIHLGLVAVDRRRVNVAIAAGERGANRRTDLALRRLPRPQPDQWHRECARTVHRDHVPPKTSAESAPTCTRCRKWARQILMNFGPGTARARRPSRTVRR